MDTQDKAFDDFFQSHHVNEQIEHLLQIQDEHERSTTPGAPTVAALREIYHADEALLARARTRLFRARETSQPSGNEQATVVPYHFQREKTMPDMHVLPETEGSLASAPFTRRPPRSRRARRAIWSALGLVAALLLVLINLLLWGPFAQHLKSGQSNTHNGTTPSSPAAGTPPEKRLTVIEGWRLEQIANKTAELGLSNFHAQEFLKYTHHPDLFPDAAKYPLLQHAPSMEGLLYPATYQIPANANTVQVIDMMLNELTQVLRQNNLMALAQQHRLTEYQMLILASIVQREASNAGQMPKIAGIDWNRLYKPTPETAGYLASNPTVEYAYDTDNPPSDGNYWRDLNGLGTGTTVDKESRWNTYTHRGLPPTPISSPGLAALQAAASPAPTNCYYFLLKPADGSVVCTQTSAQLQQLVNEYLRQ